MFLKVEIFVQMQFQNHLAQVIGFIKGKSATHIAMTYMGRKKNFTG
jgi:putative transposase